MKKRVLCVMLAAAVSASLLAGCGSGSQEETTENVQQDVTQQEADEGETTEGVEGEGTQESGAYATAVAYASNSSAQVCDIYLPEGDGPYPVVVVFHGGGFMFGAQDMEIIQPIISACVANGYAVVSADYRKSSEATFPAAVADAKAVVRFVKESASEYGFDADNIAVWGESAGAYLALMTALTPAVDSLDGDVTDHDSVDSSVNALVTFYAPVEFVTMKEEYESWGDTTSGGGNFESQFLGVDDIYSAPDACAAAYWENYTDELPSDFTLQAWIEVGDENDTNVPYTQSVNFAERLSGVIGESNVTFVQLPGAAHEDDAFYTDENLADVIAFLDEVLRK